MLNLRFICTALVLLNISQESIAQSRTLRTTDFTWEGASKGNRAIWNANDTLNIYKDVDGVDVTVKIIDPFKLNTTTLNPSEFNDFTKTNTFYNRGNLALQIKSTTSAQPVCLQFNFSHPVMMDNFNVFDIDMLQTQIVDAGTYQDSISFDAKSKMGKVPLFLSKLVDSTSYTIYGQSVKANFIEGYNGDLAHTDLRGALNISSQVPLEQFTLCYSNGSEDEGVSNSHAIKIPGFSFEEYLGTISGKVISDDTGLPLAGSIITLRDMDGNIAVNKEGWMMQVETDATGTFYFDYLPMGEYRIVQINPQGYESSRDIYGDNDNMVYVKLDFTNPVSIENNFYEIVAAPLPVNLVSFDASKIASNVISATWQVENEVNVDYYQIEVADKVGEFKAISKVSANADYRGQYKLALNYNLISDITYVRLLQFDFDGQKADLGIRAIKNGQVSEYVQVYPNPTENLINISTDSDLPLRYYEVLDQMGHVVLSNNVLETNGTSLQIDLTELPKGVYLIKTHTDHDTLVHKVVKR